MVINTPLPCSADPELFFDTKNKDSVATAKALCSGCPIKGECQKLGIDEEYGIWGGQPAKVRQIWTDEMVVQLLTYRDGAGMRWVDIAEVMGVGAHSCRLKYAKLMTEPETDMPDLVDAQGAVRAA